MTRRARLLLLGAAVALIGGAVLVAVLGDGWPGSGGGEDVAAVSTTRPWMVTLIGDSQVQRGEWSELLGVPAANHGVGGLEIRDVTARVGQVVPEGGGPVVVWAGTNDLFRRGTAEVEGDMAALLEEVAATTPEADVLVLTVPPLPGLGSDVGDANAALARAAYAGGASLLDVTEALSGQGRMHADGVHLSEAGYEAVGGLLRDALATP